MPTDCNHCALCCRYVNVPPFTYRDGDAPPEPLRREIETFEQSRRLANVFDTCIWLDPDTLRCRHYEDRPRACRNFELDGATCRDMRRIAKMDETPRH
ncbi:MAG: zinc/iron-chelating domain-containing protein [Phycisphaeraceae bacterium]|nr:zinc/iron-chelating domain-containing protein [Phycisphaeraceae bacterium]